MKTSFTFFFALIVCSFFLVGCQETVTLERYQKILDNQEHLNEGQKQIMEKIEIDSPLPLSEKEDLVFDLDSLSLTYKTPRHDLLCVPDTKVSCTKSGCQKNKPTIFLLYDESIQTLYRCDINPCDAYSVEDKTSGIYKNLKSIDMDLRLKIQDSGGSELFAETEGEYVEITGAGIGIQLNFGRCISNTNK